MNKAFALSAMFVALLVSAETKPAGKFSDPERVVAVMAADPSRVVAWMEANYTQEQCRALEDGLFLPDSGDSLIAAQRARTEAVRAGLDSKIVSDIDAAISDIKATINAKSPVAPEEGLKK